MTTINQFIEDNHINVVVKNDDVMYVCHITGESGTFKFSMTRERLLDHISRFTQQEFTEAILGDERAIRTHFRRLAVTWWHIAVFSDERNMEIK